VNILEKIARFVANLNNTYTLFYTRWTFQPTGEELSLLTITLTGSAEHPQ